MTKEIAIPANKALAAQLAAVVQTNPIAAGDAAFMKFAKGEWVYGADESEADARSEWAVNPHSFRHGYIVWADEEVVDEQMVTLGQACPATPSDGNYQVAFEMVCVSGPDKGVHVMFKTSSKGGTKAVMQLIKAISAQASTSEEVVPVVNLATDSYKHKQYGKVHTPVFDIKSWVGMDATAVPEAEDDDEPAEVTPEKSEAADTGRRRRRA